MGRNRKREWFAYVKTKQFWLVLVFGWVLLPYHSLTLIAISLALLGGSWLTRLCKQTNPRPLHNRHKHLLLPPRRRRGQHPCLSILFQLRPPQYCLDFYNPLQIRFQRLVQNGQNAWLEIPDPLLFRRRRQLLHRPRLPIHDYSLHAASEFLGHCHRHALQFFLHESSIPTHADHRYPRRRRRHGCPSRLR